MDKYYIPKFINEPKRIIFFTVDELIVIGLIMLPALTFNQEIVGCIVSAVVCYIYRAYKGKESSSFLQRIAYWKFNIGSRHYIPAATSKKYKG